MSIRVTRLSSTSRLSGPGSVIALDDTALSEQMSEILKGVTTSFAEPFKYHTVSKDRKGQECRIPERCVWWVAKVEGGQKIMVYPDADLLDR